jgi:alanyl-tRNA synthetase
MYVTIFKGENGVERDSEAYDLWLGQGVPKDRIYEFGAKDNFWQMGDTGPCGPCSEIHYDMGPAASDQRHTDCAFGCDCGRYVEIWNLVFMQFDRDASGKLTPLPKPSIDTGMGLERIAAVLQGVISNYDTDLFVPLIKRAAELTGVSFKKELDKEAHTKSAASLRVIADHSRAATFLISDGVTPANEGRGYVLRKIIRRAITHGRLLGQTNPFLHEMVFAVRDDMQAAYPDLKETTDRVSRTVLSEEMQFARTLAPGLKLLEQGIAKATERISLVSPPNLDAVYAHLRKASQSAQEAAQRASESLVLKMGSKILQDFQLQMQAVADDMAAKARELLEAPQMSGSLLESLRRFNENLHQAFQAPASLPEVEIEATFGKLGQELTAAAEAAQVGWYPGDAAFKLYDTFGVPPDFTQDAARDQGLVFDHLGFDRAMSEQRDRARASWKGATKQTANPAYQQLPKSTFEGYRQTRSENCEVLAIVKDRQGAQELKPGDQGEIILDHTPFYAESGGQVGDRGWFYSDDHNTVVAEVTGCYSPIQGVRAHQVIAKQPIRVGQKVDAVVNTDIRQSTMRNHTATHLLHAGLREVLGKHVKQAGSLVAPNHLRFDFSHFTGVEDEELQDIEDIINKEVLRNEKVEVIENVPIDVAVNEYHAMALFGEKYGDKVRVIRIGDFSTELCGGTHTLATGEIGLIKILKEGSVSSGVRRIEAVTGEGSLKHFREDHEVESFVSSFAHPKTHVSPRKTLEILLHVKDEEIKRLGRELDQARMKSASSSVASASDNIREVRGVKVLAHRVDNLERPQLRTLVDQLRDKLGSGVVVVGSASNGNVSLIAGVTKDLTSRIQAGKVVGAVAEKVGGKGGGRPDLAEAGGKNPEALDSALAEVYKVVESLLG